MKHTALILSLLAFTQTAHATDQVRGKVTAYQSYHGVVESCVQIAPVPGGAYDEDDIEDEAALCGLDFYSHDLAICPKVWSTSAAVVVYDITEGKFKGERTAFQEKVCAGGKVAKYVAHDKPARLKFTMNQQTTSAVNTPASLLYYHLSRYFGLTTKVPVAVWRDMDKNVLLNEVVLGGIALSEGRAHLHQNHAAWQTLKATIADPAAYEQQFTFGTAADLVTADNARLFGVMYDGGGDEYGTEINGVSPHDAHMPERFAAFLETPAILALTTDAPLRAAIETGLQNGTVALQGANLTAADISPQQMAFWMQEMSEIMLLDYILGQRDRITNFDHRTYFYWLEDGKVKRKRARNLQPGDGKIPADAMLIARTRINDNDAAGRTEYINIVQQAGLLERIRHFDAAIYSRLLEMNADLAARGPLYDWLSTSLGLEPDQVEMIVTNTALAADILQASCLRGELRFDLDAKAFFATGEAKTESPACIGS